ncbi:MAG: PD-(D/E)XK nuclease family protein [Methanomicrobiales archaeon]
MPDRTLYLTPPGTGFDACLRSFTESLYRDPLHSRLILPTSVLAREATRRILEEIPAIPGDCVTTPRQYAAGIVEKRRPDLTIISETARRRIIHESIRESGDRRMFTTPGSSSRAASDLSLLFQELVACQKADSFFDRVDNERIARIADIFRACQRTYADHGLVDRPSLYHVASQLLDDAGDQSIWVFGIRSPYPDLRSFFQRLAGSARQFIVYHPFADTPKIFSDRAEWLGCDRVIPLPDTGPGSTAGLFSGGTGPVDGPETLVHEFRSETEELEAVAEEIGSLLERGCDPEDIVIGVPDLAPAVVMIRDIFPDFGLPFTSRATLPLSRSPVVQAIVHVLGIPVRGYRRDEVVGAFFSPHTCPSPANPAEIDRITRKAQILDGYDAWARGLTRLKQRLSATMHAPETPEYRIREATSEREAADRVGALLDPFLAGLRDLERPGGVRDHVARIRSLLAGLPAGDPGRLSVGERQDVERFSGLLDELETITHLTADREMDYPEFFRMLRAETGEKKVQWFGDPGGIRVAGMRELQHMSVPVVFLIGLTDDAVPRVPGLLPFLSEDEERRIDPDMKARNLRDERYYLVSALLSATTRIYATTINSPGDRGQIPSPFYREIVRGMTTREWDPPVVTRSRRRRQVMAGRCIGEGVWPNTSLLAGREDPSCADLLRRVNMEYVHRHGEYDSPFDGNIGVDDDTCTVLAGRFGDDHTHSVSSLETYATCPFRFYMRHVLGLEKPEDVEITLSPADRGSLIHEVLAAFYSTWMEKHGRPIRTDDRDAALAMLTGIARQKLDEFGKEGAAWDAFAHELLGTGGFGRGILEQFCDLECAREGSPLRPALFECSFGFAGVGNTVSDEPVSIRSADGAGFRLRGVIDRVDLSDDGRFTVTDYKTGSHPTLSDIIGGRSFQLPLYIRSFETLTGRTGIAGAYYRLHREEVQHRAELHDPGSDLVTTAFSATSRMRGTGLSEVIDASIDHALACIRGMREGRFPLPLECRASRYCDFGMVCRFSTLRVLGIAGGGDRC